MRIGQRIGTRAVAVALAGAVVGLLAVGVTPAAAATPVDLQNAANVHIDGQATADEAGSWVGAAGDVNGDGIDDLLVCAIAADQNGRAGSGSGYVVYGQRHLTNVDLQTLGQNGFRIDGAAASDSTCWSGNGVGDVNGDGIDDVAVGAPGADNNGRSGSGSAYVVYGQKTADPSDVDLANITTTQASRGYRIDGALANDGFGTTVSAAGDFNHDGIDDMVIGAQSASNNGRAQSGSAYVIYGQPTADPTEIDLANLSTTQASRGMRIDGAVAGDNTGWYFGHGDVNGDGIADVAIASPFADDNGRSQSGSVAVVYGQPTGDPTDVDLANITGSQATRGMLIDGGAAGNQSGYSTAVGDINGDGVADVVVGSVTSDHNGRTDSGSAEVVYGQHTADPTDVDLAGITGGDASRGMEIDGAALGDQVGFTSSAGDVNGDGITDVVIGAPATDNNGRATSGSMYVIDGQQAADPSDVDLSNITGSQASRGTRIDGAAAGDEVGFAGAFAGDLNGDGFGDVAAGAVLADNNGRGASGSVYIAAIPPPNDDFANAESLSGSSASATDGTGFASKESGEPDHAGQAGGASVWWSWTAPTDGLATVDLCHSDFDTLLGVYTGSAVNSLSTVAGDDDGCGSPAGPSRASFQATQGTTYRIAVDGHDPGTGRVALHLALTDDIPPDVSIDSGPGEGSSTSDTTPSWSFSSTDGTATFRCRIDGASYASCASPFTPSALTEGQHAFQVKAVDPSDNASDPLTRDFTVDTTAPTATIGAGPGDGSTSGDRDPLFGFTSNEGNSTFECDVDSAGFAPCSSPEPLSGLTDGSHTFSVRATDAAGNQGPAASRTWTVDATGPIVSIVSGPNYGSFTKDSTPTFTFTANEPSTYQCRYEGHSFAACSGASSDTPATALANGVHTFYVRPIDQVGNRGDPLDIQFTVDTVPPTITISGPSTVTTTGTKASATFRISASEVVTNKCRVDAKPLVSCGSSYKTPQLPIGTHTFTVRATDRAQNVTTKTKTFKIVKG